VSGRILLADDGPPQDGEAPPATLVGEAEIFFAHLDPAHSQQLFGDHNFVFSGELKNILGLAHALGPAKEETAAQPG
jgi:hypothetical protein